MHAFLAIAGWVLPITFAILWLLFGGALLETIVTLIHFGAVAEGRGAIFWCAVEGALFGFLLSLEYPESIIRQAWLPGSSMVIAPIGLGAINLYLRKRDVVSGRLFTFWGGCIFAFAFAAVRYLAVHHR